jgi:hypothetical protein
MYVKAVYRTIISMTSFYLENVCTWLKTALYDAPYRVYLDVELEKQKIKREIDYLSRIDSSISSSE